MNEKEASVKSGIFTEMVKPQQAYLKMGIFGEAGSGKSFTAVGIAIGLHKHIGSQKPIAYFDTETGSDFLLDRFQKAKIKLLVAKSRAFKDLSEAIPQAEKTCDILIIDSLTHPWNELLKSYLRTRRDGGRFIRIQDWGPIKDQWGVGFSVPYVSSKLHVIWCARSANIFEDVEDADAPEGKAQFKAVKVGTKARSETETAYEPSLLVEMTKVMLQEGGRYARRASVIKDRFDAIDSKEFDDPIFENFIPHISLLSIGGEHFPLEAGRTSDDLFDDSDRSVVELRKRRQIALEKIENALAFAFPSRGTEDKKANLAILRGTFGTDSWTEISGFHPDQLESSLETINQVCRLAIKGEKIEDYETKVKELSGSTSIPQTQRQNERSDPQDVSEPKAGGTTLPGASGEAIEGDPVKPSAAKPGSPMSVKQEGLLRAILNSHVFSEEERKLIEAEIPLMNRFKASKRIDQLRKEAEKRKKAESGKTSAAFDDPGERPSYLSVIERYLQDPGQDEMVRNAGFMRLKRVREGTDKLVEADYVDWIRGLHLNITGALLTDENVKQRFSQNQWPWSEEE